jgi:hypothetical protein
MPTDDRIWDMFAKYGFVTAPQAMVILGKTATPTYYRLRRLYEDGWLGRERQGQSDNWLYFIKNPERAIDRGLLKHEWSIQRKATNQIPHEVGITDCQIIFYRHFPTAEIRRWRADLLHDFKREVPDLYFDLKDGIGWVPFEYVRRNPITEEKFKDYLAKFPRSYFVVPTGKYLENLLEKVEDDFPSTKLWFTYEDVFYKNPKGKIWYCPKDFRDRARSILPPKS